MNTTREPIHCVLPKQDADINESTRIRDVATRWEVTFQLTFDHGMDCFWCANGRAYYHQETGRNLRSLHLNEARLARLFLLNLPSLCSAALRHDAPAAPSTSPPASSAPTPGASASSPGPIALLPSASSRGKRNRKKKGIKRERPPVSPPAPSTQSTPPPPALASSVSSAETSASPCGDPSPTSSPVAAEALPPSSSLASPSPTPEREKGLEKGKQKAASSTSLLAAPPAERKEEEKGKQKADSSASLQTADSLSSLPPSLPLLRRRKMAPGASTSQPVLPPTTEENNQPTVGNNDDEDEYITVQSRSKKQKIKEQNQQFVDVLGASKERLDKLPYETRLILQGLVGIKSELADVKGELADVKGELADVKSELADQRRKVTMVAEVTALELTTKRLAKLGVQYLVEWRWDKKRLSEGQATSLYDKLGQEYTLLRERIGERVCQHRPIPCSDATCQAVRIKRLKTIEYNAIGDSEQGTIIAEFTTTTFKRRHLLEPGEASPEFEWYQVALLSKLAQLERQVAALDVVEKKTPLFACLVVYRSEVSEEQVLKMLAAWKTALPQLYALSQQQRFHMCAWCLDLNPEHISDAPQHAE
ncbi:hypothetical protein QOT17_010612 [Balamuthia mandrillaris]